MIFANILLGLIIFFIVIVIGGSALAVLQASADIFTQQINDTLEVIDSHNPELK